MADQRTPNVPVVDQFRAALRAEDGDRVRALLETEPDARAAVNAPIGHFGGRPLSMVRNNLPIVDLVLAYGADLNLKSEWWPGGFGLLESDCTPGQAAPLIARDGDGKTALHCRTAAIAHFLLERGADIYSRCVDQQSSAAQYLVREAESPRRAVLSDPPIL